MCEFEAPHYKPDDFKNYKAFRANLKKPETWDDLSALISEKKMDAVLIDPPWPDT